MYSDLLDFVSENSLMSSVIGTIIALNANDMATSLADDVIIPIFDRDLDDDGRPDVNIIKNFKVTITGVPVRMGEFLLKVLRLIIIIVIVFLVYMIFKRRN